MKKVLITYHMTNGEEDAETCIALPMADEVAEDVLTWGDDSRYIFCTLFLGADAYGKTKVEGSGLEVIVKQKGSSGSADPLNQRSSVGWKAIKCAERLSEEYMVRVESERSYPCRIQVQNQCGVC